MRHCKTVIVLLVAILTLFPQFASAQESWLDGDLASWNTAGMVVPPAPAAEGNVDSRCAERERPAETAEDA